MSGFSPVTFLQPRRERRSPDKPTHERGFTLQDEVTLPADGRSPVRRFNELCGHKMIAIAIYVIVALIALIGLIVVWWSTRRR